MAEGLLEDKPVDVNLDIADDLPAVPGDRLRSHQAILNLVSNACKFTEQGAVTIRAYPEADQVIVAISDTGPGISEDERADVFEPYKQVGVGRENAGTGLGLPIAKRLAESMGGRLWLESVAGDGATFYLVLPAGEIATSPPA